MNHIWSKVVLRELKIIMHIAHVRMQWFLIALTFDYTSAF